MEDSRSIIIRDHWLAKVVLAALYCFIGWLAYSYMRTQGNSLLGILTVILVTLIACVHVWLYMSKSFTELNDEGIVISVPGRRTITRWEDVSSIIVKGKMYTINSEDSSLVVSLTRNKDQVEEVKEFINKQCLARNIEFYEKKFFEL